MKKIILVLMGGISGEKEISILSGRACVKALRKKKYKVKILDPKGNFINEIRKIKPKIVFNALHGRFGEDGYIQSILESEKIKYTRAWKKELGLKSILMGFGLNTDDIHSPDEHYGIFNYLKGIETIPYFFQNLVEESK